MNTARTVLLSLLIATGAATVGATANAQFTFKTEINAVELTPANIVLPATANGMVSFRPCDGECAEPYTRVQLTPETTFSIDGERMKFDDFRRAFPLAKRSQRAYALINYDVETQAATNIEILQ
ncbi:MAG: hypothetical protein AAFX56_20100 [Pseudomonadota bacterium]